MSNIENLKKQAKQIQRWHRDRRWTVATDIRNALPAFQGLTDREVFERAFKLADAQAVVARRYGFADWPALAAGFASKAKSETTTATELPEPPSRVEYVLPFIFVRDLPAALVFYAERLGFGIEFAYGEPPFYAQVIRDGVRLALKHADEDVCDVLETLRRGQGDELLAASIALDRAKALFLEYERAGVKFYQTLRRETWGAWSFIVEDRDGNLIAFGGRGEHAIASD